MPKEIIITSLEQLEQYANKGVIEIVTRNKNKRFNMFYKAVIDSAKKSGLQEKATDIGALLNKNNQLATKSIEIAEDIKNISQFTMILSGLNLFATVAGFAVMNAKLNKMSKQIEEVIKVYKEAEDIHTNYEVNKVILEHSNMLDCRKTHNYYTEDEMWELVAEEYNILDMLMSIFTKNMTVDREVLVFTILSVASMLAASLKYYDEVYYFNNKDVIGDGEVWHTDHDKWTSVFDSLISKDYVELIQDFGMFDLNLTTLQNDYFYKSYINKIVSLKQDIEDNQTLITAFNDPELFSAVTARIKDDVKEELENTLKEAGKDPGLYKKEIRIAAA